MHPLEDFIQNGGAGLSVNDLIRLQLTGSRGGGPVEQVSAYFDIYGQALNDDLTFKSGAIPLDLTALPAVGGVGGVATKPTFPMVEYSAALNASDYDKASKILDVHKAALAAVQSGGTKTVEDVVIDAGLQYCYEHLKYSPVDVADRFVVARSDVVLNKETKFLGGIARTVFTVRLASRFGA